MTAVTNLLRTNRGAFILFEGCDCTGKSTQALLLQKHLQTLNIPARLLKFPDRETHSGNLLNSYLVNQIDLNDESVHLIFAANRWEMHKEMEDLLERGITLIVDRFSFSGIAYGIAKGLDTVWCFAPELGLLRPDYVFYMQLLDSDALQIAAERKRFSRERYDQIQFQSKVSDAFDLIYQTSQHYWKGLNALDSIGNLHLSIIHTCLAIIEDVKYKPLSYIQASQILDITSTLDDATSEILLQPITL